MFVDNMSKFVENPGIGWDEGGVTSLRDGGNPLGSRLTRPPLRSSLQLGPEDRCLRPPLWSGRQGADPATGRSAPTQEPAAPFLPGGLPVSLGCGFVANLPIEWQEGA